jgi:hypothetical protein
MPINRAFLGSNAREAPIESGLFEILKSNEFKMCRWNRHLFQVSRTLLESNRSPDRGDHRPIRATCHPAAELKLPLSDHY